MIPIIGILLAATGMYLVHSILLKFWNNFRIRSHPVQARAKIVKCEDATTEGDTADWTKATAEFVDEDGIKRSIELWPTKESRKYRVGGSVSIVYQKGNSKNCRASDEPPGLIARCIGLIIGVCLVGVGSLMILGKVEVENDNPQRTIKVKDAKAD